MSRRLVALPEQGFSRLTRAMVVLALLTSSLAAPSAQAAPSSEAIAEAKLLFRAGAEAFSASDFEAALQAFEAARAIAPDPALTFSIAQTHRRQFGATERPASLRAAVSEYRRYLAEVSKGGRRGDAAEALVELEPKFAQLAESDAEGAAAGRRATRLMVLTSVEGAMVSLDGAAPEAARFIGEVEPGTHVVRVTAEGHNPYLRTLEIKQGEVISIDPLLQPLPAQLLVRGEAGATLWVDGRTSGTLPLVGAVPVPPGRRLIAVTEGGRRRFELEVHLDKGQHKDLDVSLEPTAQRTVSFVTLALGGASLLAGGVLAAVAGATYHHNRAIYDEHETGTITDEQLRDYDSGRDDHGPLVLAAIVTGAVGVAVTLTGAGLYLFDEPAPPSLVGAARPAPARARLAVVPSAHGAWLALGAQF